jgi:hypothetical protein
MKIPNVLSKLIAAMPLVLMSASACGASHQPDCSTATPTVEIERSQPVAIDEELARAEHRAYVMEVARHLLHGQRSPGDCPPTSDPRACLLAARLLWLEADAEALDGPPGETAHSLRVRAAELVRSGSARAAADRQFLWALAQGTFADPRTALDYGFQSPELRTSAIAELRRREPGNLQVWLLGSEDEAWTEERLSAAAASERSDSPIWEFIRSDLKLLQDAGAPKPPTASVGEKLDALDAQHVALLGIYLAIAQPGLYSLSRACSVEGENAKPEAAEHCLRIAKVLVEGADSTLDLGLGSALLSRMSMQPEDRVRAADASQLVRYLSETHLESQKWCGGLAAHLRRMRVGEASELSALREGLVEAGLPQEPPQSWRVPTD